MIEEITPQEVLHHGERWAADLINGLRRDLERQRAALKPFAELCAEIDKQYADYPDHCRLFWSMTHGDLRKAKAAV
jgi:hypothetical protein